MIGYICLSILFIFCSVVLGWARKQMYLENYLEELKIGCVAVIFVSLVGIIGMVLTYL